MEMESVREQRKQRTESRYQRAGSREQKAESREHLIRAKACEGGQG